MRRLASAPVMVLLLLTLAGCTLHKSDDATSTPVATQPAASTAAATIAPGTGLDPTSSQSITDGICATLIPDEWVNSGNGRGTAPSGARFTLFGNKLSGDAAWTAAADIVAALATGQGATADRTADSITFTNTAGTSFEVRRRLADRYCDFSVTSIAKAPDDERALWPAIGASMTAAPAAP